MTTLHRDRQLAAIRHELPDRISIDAIWAENMPPISESLKLSGEDIPVLLGIDGRVVGVGYSSPDNGISREGVSVWGSSATDDYGTSHAYPLAAATNLSLVDAYKWPDPARYDYAGAAKKAAECAAHYAVRGPQWMPLFDRCCELLGIEDALVKMIDEPVLFEAILDKVFRHNMFLFRSFVEACGANLHALYVTDDFAHQRGMLMSPRLWRTFLKPRYAELFRVARDAGKYVWFHSCGDITAVLPDLIDIGLDVWETVQLHALPVSPENLKREYGKHITFFGGVNTQQLPFKTPDQVADEVRYCIRTLGKGGGYICGPDHQIKADVPVPNIMALFRTAAEYAENGYTS